MTTSGPCKLRDMFLVARHVNQNLITLQDSLKSVYDLMPDEDRKDNALQIMDAVYKETNGMEQLISQLRLSLENQLTSLQQERENLTTVNNTIEQGVSQIEDTLKNYGYDGSSMPGIITPELDASICSEEMESPEVNGENFPLSPLHINEFHESYGGDLITPLVLRSRGSCHSSQKRTMVSPITPSCQNMKFSSIYASGGNSLMNGSQKHLVNITPQKLSCSTTNEVKTKEYNNGPPKTLVRPQPPVLSKTTYELLGEEPPSELSCEN